jgi:hypothetical protein
LSPVSLTFIVRAWLIPWRSRRLGARSVLSCRKAPTS